jgi:hypothetical protein
MSFAKANTPRDSIDDYQRLMCSVQGCTRKWTVQMGAPKCSEHQWGLPVQNSVKKQLKPIPNTWYTKDEFNDGLA